MIESMPDMPAGVLGFEAVGEVHSNDYTDVLIPAIDRAAAEGDVRFVYLLGDRFEGYSAGAAWDDAKLGFDHIKAWKRVAVVTDATGIGGAVTMFGWLIPGEFKHFAVAERDEAVAWAAGA